MSNYRANLNEVNKALSHARHFSVLLAAQAKDPVESYLLLGIHNAIVGFAEQLKALEDYRDMQEAGEV